MSQYICAQCYTPFFTTPIIIKGSAYCQTCGVSAFQTLNLGQSMVAPVPQAYAPQAYAPQAYAPQAYAPQAFVPDGRAAAAGTNTTLWKCQHCTYEYNVIRDNQQCQRCGGPRPDAAPQFRSMPTHVPARAPPNRPENAVWTCSQCGCAFCLPDDNFCQLCGATKPGAVTNAWQCSQCGQSNYDRNEYCNSCGQKRAQGVEVKVMLRGNKWVCRCGSATPVMITKCLGCGETNLNIDRLKDAFGLK